MGTRRTTIPAWVRVPTLVSIAAICFALPAVAQQSESYAVHSSSIGQGSGSGVSENFRVDHTTSGQSVVGSSAGGQYGTDKGFINLQVLDDSPPEAPAVQDGTGADADEAFDNAELCVSWLAIDVESGIYDNVLEIGTSPGAADVVPALAVGEATGACVGGPFARCNTYFVTVRSRNGSALQSGGGHSDGLFIDDPDDMDSDGLGDECDPDDDQDGIADLVDICPCDPLDDFDADGLCDNIGACGPSDNCPFTYNPSQADADVDSQGDACDFECTLHVDALGGSGTDCTSIQSCVENAHPYCHILVEPGAYTDNLLITQPLTIESVAGAAQTTLDGGAGAPTIQIESTAGPVRIIGLTVLGGSEGVRTSGDTEIIDSVISGATVGVELEAPTGGPPGKLKIAGSTIENGSAGVLIGAGSATLSDSTVAGCVTGVRIENGELALRRTQVRDSAGQGIEIARGLADIDNSLVTDNAQDCVHVGYLGSATVTFSTISGCDRGVYQQNPAGSALSIEQSIVHGNLSADLSGNVDCDRVFRSATASDCCSLNGNLCANPLFVDPPGGDYRLSDGSPCLETSPDPLEFTAEPCRDFALNPRLLDADGDGLAHADMGAFERDNSMNQVPGEVQALRFSHENSLIWNAEPGSAQYRIWSSALSALDYAYTWSCEGSTGQTSFVLGPGSPLPGDTFVFVVAGETAGEESGSLGLGTCAERSNDLQCP